MASNNFKNPQKNYTLKAKELKTQLQIAIISSKIRLCLKNTILLKNNTHFLTGIN